MKELNIKTTEVDKNGYLINTLIRVICIDGYKWLMLGDAGALSQMLEEIEIKSEKDGYRRTIIPTKCNN